MNVIFAFESCYFFFLHPILAVTWLDWLILGIIIIVNIIIIALTIVTVIISL
jgi:hypothetical protein